MGLTYSSAAANEWMIVIKDGELIRSGIGLKTWYNFMSSTVAKFPSSVSRVTFSANQTSQEMQGIEITGVVMWSVNRLEDGPYRFYKYAGQDIQAANENLRLVAESIVRNTVANHTIAEVMSQRDMIRHTIKKGIMDAVAGWGVWVETIELTDVKICSKALFEDLQAAFRQSTMLAAKRITLETQKKITQEQLAADVKLAEARADADAERRNHASATLLQCEEQEATLFEKQAELAKRKAEQMMKQKILELEQGEALKLQGANKAADTEAQKRLYKLKAEAMREEEEVKMFEKRLELAAKRATQQTAMDELQLAQNECRDERIRMFEIKLKGLSAGAELQIVENRNAVEAKMTERNMQKYGMDLTRDVYKNLPLHSVNMNNYVGAGGAGESGGLGVEALLPALTSFTKANEARAAR